jgi:hypothetical protein
MELHRLARNPAGLLIAAVPGYNDLRGTGTTS